MTQILVFFPSAVPQKLLHFESFHIIVPQSKGKFETGMPKLYVEQHTCTQQVITQQLYTLQPYSK